MAKKTDALAKTSPIGGAAAAVGMVALAEPIINFLADQAAKLTTVPVLYGKNLHVLAEQAEEKLTQSGFVCNLSELRLSDADPKYKDCIDHQIVKTIPAKNMVVPKAGCTITLIYITQEVIDESKRLFEEEQIRKADEKTKREQKRLEQREKKQERRNSKESKLKTILRKSKENENEQRE